MLAARGNDGRMRRMRYARTILIVIAASWCVIACPVAARTVSETLALIGPGDRGTISYRITAPTRGRKLPILLFSHGAGYSGDDYVVLARYWADHGFVVVQPTHLDARKLNLPADDPRRAGIWRSRRKDLVMALDRWPELVRQSPALLHRADPTHVVAAGHSFGGHSVALLAGMTVKGTEPLGDRRIRGVLLLSPPGGFDGLATDWQRRTAYLDADWSAMRIPALTIIGALDRSAMSPRDASWHADAYRRAPGSNACLVTLADAGHFLGGVGGQMLTLATDPANPAAVAIVQRASLAFFRAAVTGARFHPRTFAHSISECR